LLSAEERTLGRPDLEVLVATYEERILGLAERLPPPAAGIAWLVSHQVPSGRAYDVEPLSARVDVRYVRWADSGTSRNRNHALHLARGEICLIADDDVSFLPGWSDAILSTFRTKPRIVFATFVSLSRRGQPRKASYPLNARAHSRVTVSDVSEIEIAFRLDAVRNLCVEFDERVGPGTKIVLGEGYFFLKHILERGGIGWQVPEAVVRHMSESSSGERGGAALSREFVIARSALAFSDSGYRAFLSIPKTAVWFAWRDRQWWRLPEFMCNLTVGAVVAARLHLSHSPEDLCD
jgi:glycosyltransferase involved in cell wall biosynthesis